jgi:hypothetical protein
LRPSDSSGNCARIFDPSTTLKYLEYGTLK